MSAEAAPAVQASAQPVSVDQLVQLLAALTTPDTAMIREAERQLKPVLKRKDTMMALWQVIVDRSRDTGVRHVAAIVLRKRLPGHYAAADTSAEEKIRWQAEVLQALAQEPVRPVRAGLVGVAAALASQDGAATPPVLQFLEAAANNPQPQARELCFWLLQEMTDTVGMHWKQHVAALQQLFSACLTNAAEDAAVQKAAVTALGQLMSFWADDADDQLQVLAPLLPTLLQVASVHATADAHNAANQNNPHLPDEDFLSAVLDVLYDLAYSPAACLQPHLQVTVEFSLACLRNRSLELRIRDAAALVIATTAEAKPKSVGRNDAMLGAILDTLFQLMQESPESAAGALFESNPAWRQDLEQHHGAGGTAGGGDMDDEGDFDSPTETSMAQGTLDMLACEIPKKYIWPPSLQRCLERMADANNAAARKAGVAGLGVIAEGCSEPLTAQLPQVLPAVFNAAQDGSAQVRECACFCLGQISEHCQPDILQYSTQILPIVFQLLDDQSVAVQVTSCYVLEMFCERLEPAAVRPLLDPLVRKLADMLKGTSKRSVQEMAVAALAATAVAAEEEFAPYVQGVASLMANLISIQDPHLFSLRGRALECMGHIAIAVGRDQFRDYFPVTMQSAMEGLTTDSTDLQEFAYAVFANLAKVMKEEFAPALADLVPHLIKVIEQDEGQLEKANADADGGGTGGGGSGAPGAALSNLDDSDDEDDMANLVLHVRTALLEVKKGAITALGEMAAHTGTAFCPHLEESMQVLQKAAGNWHPLIKAEAADAFCSMITPSIAAYHGGKLNWTKGDLQSPNPMSQHTAALVQAVLTEEVALLKDEDKLTVTKACEACQSVIELTGPHAMQQPGPELLQATHNLLTKKAPCYTAEAGWGELPDDDDDDHDAVMQAACDVVGAFGRVLGSHFETHLQHFFPAVLEYSKASRPAADRSMAVGCLSEIAQELPSAVHAHWRAVFFPVAVAGLADADDNVKRNAAFLAGVCCEHCRNNAAVITADDYAALLQHLGPIFQLAPPSTSGDGGNVSDATAACVDNAAAAVARMMVANLPQVQPLNQVLPVFLTALPLKTDMTENETVYGCLLGLLSVQQPEVMALKPQVIQVLQVAVHPDSKVDDETKTRLQSALQALQ